MKEETVAIKGMHCASCAFNIENKLTNSKGVKNVKVNYATEKATIIYDDTVTSVENLNADVKDIGYELDIHTDNHAHHKLEELNKQRNRLYFLLPVATFLFLFMLYDLISQRVSYLPMIEINMVVFNSILFLISTVTIFIFGKQFVEGLLRFIRGKGADMDTLIGLGTIAAYIYSTVLLVSLLFNIELGLPESMYYDSVIIVIGFVLLGKFLEARSKIKTGEAIQKLLNLQAKTAVVERDGKEKKIDVSEIVIGDILIIKAGAKIPVDGKIVSGLGVLDLAMLTGEPIPVEKTIGDDVFSGSVNKQGYFKFKALKVGSDTMLSTIIKMVEEAQNSKAPIQNLADKISSIFVPTVLVIAILSLLVWIFVGQQYLPFNDALTYGISSFVAVLVIACPCALGLATPTAIIVGVGKGAQNGILIKNAESLEKLYKVDTVIFDKTGTLTKGQPEVTDIIFNGKDKDNILSLLYSLEEKSDHPLAIAIQNKAKELNIKLKVVDNFKNIDGRGVSGTIEKNSYYAGNSKFIEDLGITVDKNILKELSKEGKTPIIFANSKETLAIVVIADQIKKESKKVIEELHSLGIKTAMLTGDNSNVANNIAKDLDIDMVYAEVLPNEKANIVKKLQNNGNFVAMVGDGINDAPALAQSNVGIAMATGTDIAIESSDITLLGGDISKLPKALKLSRNTMKTIKQNLFWAFFYNILGIPLAAGLFYPMFGILLEPAFAGIAMALSSVTVVSNSLRLKLTKI
ncbi:MAG: heavy metal translocating P-type ATPase, Cu2+-exporting ATPase [candidate division WS6 bacterium GW2011_GWC1_33_20]|uniref:P-type Cu(+) transporter n=2 Tax=Candidatus Dojkabacteria TaxID=74243 RepID=A0A0G0AT30_9BACT|nr:MAG: heavy metal translocating P-type ATPase, Cu2+-exporting ATPase [candidate division WS6 bacterium GW2011_GWE2_33_157]KKP44084.1 MAG: heavy metal translocating P-type ATPase, Cu2+-exporting ATPase [candidate division WS6 bacterium GW2011_GWC1_33_20]KKP45044.1 MAG: heavy metal translocating P-type ATPase, Cu2+-exporting ATPase [candidate division WS6 bacterium GW2011_GWF1_33_233]KKP54211.1 MAG: heavy metal translocating P-type ATPase, Cu2+-exporting ATPase [candidate division WS6 bacterium 